MQHFGLKNFKFTGKKLLGFCENKKIKSLPLYIFSDLKYLDSTDLVNVEQKRFLKSAFDLEKDHRLCRKDFKRMLEYYGYVVTKEDRELLFGFFDVNKDQELCSRENFFRYFKVIYRAHF